MSADLFTAAKPRCVRVVGVGSTQFRVWSNGACSYRYEVPGAGTMEFSLFSEVGEPYKPAFERIFRVFNVQIDGGAVEMDHKPWFADRLLSMDT